MEEYGWDMRFEGLIAEVAGQFLNRFDPEMEYCWIAERAGINIGSVLIANGGDGIAKLRLLYIDKAARGLGLGRTLVENASALPSQGISADIALDQRHPAHRPQHLCQGRLPPCLRGETQHVRSRTQRPDLGTRSLNCQNAKVSLDLETIVS
jgi:GNAT superfamily N-acetyltransferase